MAAICLLMEHAVANEIGCMRREWARVQANNGMQLTSGIQEGRAYIRARAHLQSAACS
jgi:hypothetical protein